MNFSIECGDEVDGRWIAEVPQLRHGLSPVSGPYPSPRVPRGCGGAAGVVLPGPAALPPIPLAIHP